MSQICRDYYPLTKKLFKSSLDEISKYYGLPENLNEENNKFFRFYFERLEARAIDLFMGRYNDNSFPIVFIIVMIYFEVYSSIPDFKHDVLLTTFEYIAPAEIISDLKQALKLNLKFSSLTELEANATLVPPLIEDFHLTPEIEQIFLRKGIIFDPTNHYSISKHQIQPFKNAYDSFTKQVSRYFTMTHPMTQNTNVPIWVFHIFFVCGWKAIRMVAFILGQLNHAVKE